MITTAFSSACMQGSEIHDLRGIRPGDLRIYLDPVQLSALSNGDPVTNFPDLSSRANHATQAVQANAPTFYTAGIGGNPALLYSTDDYLLANGVAGSISGNDQPVTGIFVCDITQKVAQTILSFGRSVGTTTRPRLMYDRLVSGSDLLYRLRVDEDASIGASATGADVAGDAPEILAFRTDRVGGQIFRNGTQVGSFANASIGQTTLDMFSIGARVVGTGPTISGYMEGYLGVLAIWSALLSDAEILSISRGLGQKYGISVA